MLGTTPLSVVPLSTLESTGAAGAYTLTADSASFVITGTAANLEVGHKLVAGGGSYVITGTAANLEYGREIAAASGSYVITGGAATLRATRLLSAASASFVITGTDASLEVGRKLSAASAAFLITGTDAGLRATRLLTAGSAAFLITGTDASLEPARELTAGSGAFIITPADATLTYVQTEGSAPRVVSGLGNYAYGVRKKKKLPEELIEAVEAVAEAAEDETGLVAALDALERDMAAAVQRNRGLVERFAYQELVAFLEAEQRRLRAIEIAALERHLAERKRLMEMVDAEAEELLALLQIID